MRATADSASRSEWLVHERAAVAHVERVGRVVARHERPYGVVVLDPLGKEVTWLSATFEFMGKGAYSPRTYRAYAESFLRAARCAWALDVEMSSLRPYEYGAIRALLQDPERNGRGSEYRPQTLLLTEHALMTVYGVANMFGVLSIDNPVRAVVDGFTRMNATAQVHPNSARRAGRRSWIARRSFAVGPVLGPKELRVLEGASDPTDVLLVRLLLDAGPRVSEVLSITLDSLQPESGKISVTTKSAGGRGSRQVPATPDTFTAIMAYVSYLEGAGIHLGPADPILRKPFDLERPLTRFDAYHRLVRIVPGANPHTIRRTIATLLSESVDGPGDARLIRVREILGHQSVTTTERYLHYDEDQLVVDLLSAAERAKRKAPPPPSRFYAYDVRDRVDQLKGSL